MMFQGDDYMLDIGIFAKTFARQSVEEVFQAVKNYGIQTVQFNLSSAQLPSMPNEIPSHLSTEIIATAEKFKVNIAAISGTFNMIHPELNVRVEGFRRLEVLAKFAYETNIPMITLCTGTRNPNDQWAHHPDNNTKEAWDDLITSMENALKITQPYNIQLGIEPELSNVVNSAQKARKLLDYFQSPRLKIIMDGANLIDRSKISDTKLILTEAFELLGDDIELAHAKDIGEAEEAFVAPGQGRFDFEYYIDLFREVNFNGPLIMHGLHEDQVEKSMAFLKMICK